MWIVRQMNWKRKEKTGEKFLTNDGNKTGLSQQIQREGLKILSF
jgi:hypothetical protein